MRLMGGLVTGEEQQNGVGYDLLPGVDALPFTISQYREQVILGFGHPLVHHRGQVLGKVLDALGVILHPVAVPPVEEQQVLGHLPDHGTVFAGQAQHLGDNQQGQGHREVVHHVHAALGLGLVQQLVDGRLHQGAPHLHGPGVEVAVDYHAFLGVLGPVVLDETVVLPVADVVVQLHVVFVDGGVGRAGVPLVKLGGEYLRVAGHPYQVLKAGDYPDLVFFVPVDRIIFPQLSKVSVGVGDNLRGE